MLESTRSSPVGDQVPGVAPTPPTVLRVEEYRVKMADVDAASIIYFASPLRWKEMIFTNWLADIGHPLREMLDGGAGCPCVECSVRYRYPLRLDDVIRLELVATHVGRSSIGLRVSATTSKDVLAVEVNTRNVWTDFQSDGPMSSRPMPEWLRSALTGG